MPDCEQLITLKFFQQHWILRKTYLLTEQNLDKDKLTNHLIIKTLDKKLLKICWTNIWFIIFVTSIIVVVLIGNFPIFSQKQSLEKLLSAGLIQMILNAASVNDL